MAIPPTVLFSSHEWQLLFLIVPLIIGLYAQLRISGTFAKYAKIRSHSGITGYDAAEFVLRSAGITNVKIVEIGGHLTDHYDPSRKVLALSTENYYGISLASLGVAAHEAGHAIQDKQHYFPMYFRMGLVPVVNFAGNLAPFVILGGFLFGAMGGQMIDIGILCYAAIALFHLVTLPVEFDASNRAKQTLSRLNIINIQEAMAVRKTLDAAGFTYVATFVASLMNLLYLIMLRNDRR
jgi:hypothetical protein